MSAPLSAGFAQLSERIAQQGRILAAIEQHGGRLVASFEIDANGQTVGARLTANRFYRCSLCGEDGHSKQRCNGAGNEPKLPHAVRAKIERLRKRADYDLDEAKAEIARRLEAKGKR